MNQVSLRPSWLDRGRIPALDGIRGIAILFVLLAHSSQTKGFPIPFLGSLAHIFGMLGVETFFALSGFLITLLMQREIDRSGTIAIYGFYWRRVLRIVPAYVSFLLTVAALQVAGFARLDPREWLAALTYTVNFITGPHWEIGHIWSLSIEEHFYLLWPAAVCFLPANWKIRNLIGTLSLCLLLRWIVLIVLPEWSKFSEVCTFTRLDSIAVGCLIALLAQDDKWRAGLDNASGYAPLIIIVLILVLAGGFFSTKFHQGFTYSITAICLGLLVWTAVRINPRWLNTPLINVMGIGSYSLYLWQQIFLNPQFEGWWTRFPINLILAGFAAGLSYRFIETPFLKLKELRRTDRHELASRLAAPMPESRSDRELELVR